MESSVARAEPGRALVRSPWARAALAIAVVEAVLVVIGVIPRWVAVVAAVVLLAAYAVRGRKAASPSLRQGMWALALSQALVLLVPLVLWLLGALVVIVLAALAAVVVVALLLDR